MNKTKLKYVKYTKQELDRYVRDKNSCISLTNSEMHVGFPPWGFANFQETLTNIISRDKIGKFDTKLDGIVLEIRNIKVFGTAYHVQDDDPYNHINIKANFYVFQPRIGAVIKGAVKHISHGHVAVIIYRVFNVSIRFDRNAVRDYLKINQQISFRIKKFDLHGAMPYIEGELIETIVPVAAQAAAKKHIKFDNSKSDEESSSESDDDNAQATAGLISGLFENVVIKKEKLSDDENSSSKPGASTSNGNGHAGDSSSSSDDSSSEEESSEDEGPKMPLPVKIKVEKLSDSEEPLPKISATALKKEKNRNESSDSSSEDEDEPRQSTANGTASNGKPAVAAQNSDSKDDSSESDDDSAQKSLDVSNIKKEPESKPAQRTTYIPRPIKAEPESDIEGKSKFKKPALTATPVRKRKRESSISEHLDSIVGDLLNTSDAPKNEKSTKQNDSIALHLSDTSGFHSPALSSTLNPNSKANRKNKWDQMPSPSKIKQEPQSEDESSKRRKRNNSMKAIDDVFDSFLK